MSINGSSNDSILIGKVQSNLDVKQNVPSSQLSKSQSSITDLVQVMQSVKTDTPEAKLNQHSISDGNGGRIELDDQTKQNSDIKAGGKTVTGNLLKERF